MQTEKRIKHELKLLKDIDFKNLHSVIEINKMHKQELEDFISQCSRDTQFLSDLNIMDYSLLLIIAKNNENKEDDVSDSINNGDIKEVMKN
jgi:hypothetical protein